MVPPNILLKLAKTEECHGGHIENLPHSKPLDEIDIINPYLGQIYCEHNTSRCYEYTENGWKDVFNET